MSCSKYLLMNLITMRLRMRRHPSSVGNASQARAQERYGIITGLQYLRNNNVLSCWIGGPHGWCSWEGTIGCSNYNIGKWPTGEEVLGEWKLIAATFPTLDLRCQLMSGETCEEGIVPRAEFVVSKGRARAVRPKKPLLDAGFLKVNSESNLRRSWLSIHSALRERGCTLDQFKSALRLTEKSLR